MNKHETMKTVKLKLVNAISENVSNIYKKTHIHHQCKTHNKLKQDWDRTIKMLKNQS